MYTPRNRTVHTKLLMQNIDVLTIVLKLSQVESYAAASKEAANKSNPTSSAVTGTSSSTANGTSNSADTVGSKEVRDVTICDYHVQDTVCEKIYISQVSSAMVSPAKTKKEDDAGAQATPQETKKIPGKLYICLENSLS